MSQQIVKRIIDMLSDERVERRCAAAMVLGELGVKDATVVDALCAGLADGNPTLQLYSLEALAALNAKGIAQSVTALLDSADAEVRVRAAALLGTQGARSSAALARELEDAPPARRRAIVGIMASHHDAATIERLLRLLPDPELGETVINTLRSELERMKPAQHKTLTASLAKLIKDKSWRKHPVATAHAVRLLGYFRDAKLVQAVLPFAAPSWDPQVRLAALAALRRPLSASRSAATVVTKLFEYADDPEPAVARAAVETLRGLKLGATANGALVKLSHGQHAEARRYAVEVLGRGAAGAKETKTLLEHVLSDDPAARDAAARALAHLDGAASTLVKELAKHADDEETIARLCRVLRPHASTLTPAARKALADLAVEALEGGKASAGPLLDLLRQSDPDGYAEILTDKAMRLKRSRRHEQAFALLGLLERNGLLEDEGRYAALVSGLCSTPGKSGFGRASRTTDPVLRQAVELVGQGYPVASKLKREKSLTPEDIFYLGFNFSESRDEDQREFGGDLLAHLVTKSPRSKLGRSAKNKLRLVGLET